MLRKEIPHISLRKSVGKVAWGCAMLARMESFLVTIKARRNNRNAISFQGALFFSRMVLTSGGGCDRPYRPIYHPETLLLSEKAGNDSFSCNTRFSAAQNFKVILPRGDLANSTNVL